MKWQAVQQPGQVEGDQLLMLFVARSIGRFCHLHVYNYGLACILLVQPLALIQALHT